MIEAARAEGLDITQDQYVYTASSTGISQLVPDWAREGGKFDERLKDPATKAKIKEDMLAGLRRRGSEVFSYAMIPNYSPDTSLNGLNIMEAARKKFAANSLDDQMEIILQIQSQASGVFHSMNRKSTRLNSSHVALS